MHLGRRHRRHALRSGAAAAAIGGTLFATNVLGACGSDSPEAPVVTDASLADAIAPDAGDGAAREAAAILPYPPGPYGASVGDVLPNVTLPGYPLSREERDSTKLPFRNISIAEARSVAGCKCFVVVWNAAGNNCEPCVNGDTALTTAITTNPSICGIEIIHFSYDTVLPTQAAKQPPTRADLDDVTQRGRETYPVVLANESALLEVGGGAFPGVPSFFFVNTETMRIAAVMGGIPFDSLATLATTACEKPNPPVMTLAVTPEPMQLALDDSSVYFSDAKAGIRRVGLAGGLVEDLAAPASPPDAIALDATSVYWATRDVTAAPLVDGGVTSTPKLGSYEIAKRSKLGGSAVTLATSTSGYAGIALRGDRVYFARDDGAIGYAPADVPGAETILYSDEVTPHDLLVDDTDLYWIGDHGHAIRRGPIGGGARTSMLANDKDVYFGITFAGDKIVFHHYLVGVETLSKAGATTQVEKMAAFGPLVYDLSQDRLVLNVVDGDHPTTSLIGELGWNHDFIHLTVGQENVRSIAANFLNVYWTRSGPNGGAVVRIRK